MGIVEIYIKDDKVQRIEGNDTMVFVYDDGVPHPVQMKFKKQRIEYDDNKSIRRSNATILEGTEK